MADVFLMGTQKALGRLTSRRDGRRSGATSRSGGTLLGRRISGRGPRVRPTASATSSRRSGRRSCGRQTKAPYVAKLAALEQRMLEQAAAAERVRAAEHRDALAVAEQREQAAVAAEQAALWEPGKRWARLRDSLNSTRACLASQQRTCADAEARAKAAERRAADAAAAAQAADPPQHDQADSHRR